MIYKEQLEHTHTQARMHTHECVILTWNGSGPIKCPAAPPDKDW